MKVIICQTRCYDFIKVNTILTIVLSFLYFNLLLNNNIWILFMSLEIPM